VRITESEAPSDEVVLGWITNWFSGWIGRSIAEDQSALSVTLSRSDSVTAAV
jgi:hypothetical protein